MPTEPMPAALAGKIKTTCEFLLRAFAYQPMNTLNFLFALIELAMKTVAWSRWLDEEMPRLKQTSG